MTVIVIYTVLIALFLMVFARIRPRSRLIPPLMRGWGRMFEVLLGVRVTVEGVDRVEPNVSYVFVSNHLSNLDPPLHMSRVPARLAFLAKQELFKVPFLGGGMRAVGMVRTDRSARAAAHRSINLEVQQAADLGSSLMIYPEGTRSRDGRARPFKKGAFRLAADNGLAIVPIAISGTWEAWPAGSKIIRGGPVRMTILEPIPTTGVGPDGLSGLRDQAWQAIAAEIDRHATLMGL